MIDRRDVLLHLLFVLLLGQAGIAAASIGFACASRSLSRRIVEELKELRVRFEAVEASAGRPLGRTAASWLSGSHRTVEELRELIDGNEAIPTGLDADSIAAARRISRALNEVTPGEQARV